MINYNFSQSALSMRSSAIRELMKLATKPDIISFAGGMPGNDLFPTRDVKNILARMDDTVLQSALQYGPTDGDPLLIETISTWLESKGFPMQGNRLMVTTGSLQAINILAKIFIDPQDDVITEDPLFIGAISAFKSYQANIVGVKLDADGIDIDELEEKLKKTKPKFIYITPTFHNPAGISYTKERREKLLEVIAKYDVPVIEDDAYGELYFEESLKSEIVPLKIMASPQIDKKIFYIGTFSKLFSPGMRLGYMLVPEDVYQKAQICKQSIDACTPPFSQVFLQQFLSSGKMERYVNWVREVYKKRCNLMVQELQQHLPAEATFEIPKGGFYIWIKLPEGMDEMELLKKTIDAGAVFVVGSTFDPNGEANGCIRISYCNTSEDQIRAGVAIICDAIKSML